MRRILLLGVAAALLAAHPGGAICSSTLFVEALSVPSGGSANAVAAGLINVDSTPDLVVTNGSNGTVAVLLGQGGGAFGPPILTDLFDNLFSIAVGDFDGDLITDLAVGGFFRVFILLGNGDGTFEPPVEYSINGGPIAAIVIGAFDANASLDLAVVATSPGDPFVLLGTGTGTFGSPTRYTVGGAEEIVTGDFDGDGEVDLATSNGATGTVSLLIGVGNGTFGPAAHFLAGPALSGIAAADFDGDGSLDLVTSTDGFVSVLLGNGNGAFEAALQYPSGLGSGLLAATDLDVDGFIDVAVAPTGGGFFGGLGGVAVLLGNGDGSFGEPAAYLNGESSSGLAEGDFDDNGLPDLATADPQAQAVSVLFDQAGGVLFAAPVSPLSAGPTSSNFAQSDFNGDGHPDFVWPLSSTVGIALGEPQGRFIQGPSPLIPITSQVAGVGAGDFTGDGKPDLIVAEYSTLWLLAGLGDGTFEPAESIFSSFLIGATAIADFNGDGKLDVAIPQGCCGPVLVMVFLANGDGTFQPPVQTAFARDIRFLLAADLTGDGITDLLADISPGVALLAGNGDGTFGALSELVSDEGFYFASTGDFDGNGDADLLLSGSGANVDLLLGNGDGTFQSPILIGLVTLTGALTAGDYDGDGNLDFAVVAGPLLFFRGIGNGHFQSPIELATQEYVFLLATGDFDRNGAPDIVSGGNLSFTTLLNSRLGATVPATVSTIVGSPTVLVASAAGFGPITYQWRKNGVPLSDGGAISGSQTATLTIDPTAFTDAGSYDVVVTDSCTTATSNATTLAVEFADVPLSNPHHDDIIAIATAGITVGCTSTTYCPDAEISRAEMAVILLKAKYGANHAPPPPGGQIFNDVPPGSFAEAWIAELASLGITAGCGNGNYCPGAPVTRGEMAVFLLKTLLGSGYTPPAAAGIFEDVPLDHFAIDWIEDLYNRGITVGCLASPLRYCPATPVTRAQMATFIVRTFLTP